MAGNTLAAIKTVLVPLDGSEQAEVALPYAKALAGVSAKVILLAVVPPASDVRNIFGQVISSPQQVERGYEQVAQQQLARAAGRLGRGTTLQVQREVAVGDPVAEIARMAGQTGSDLIVMAAHGGGAWGPSALENVVAGVIDQAGQPVLVVNQPASGAGSPSQVARVVVPADEPESVQAIAMVLARALAASMRTIRAQSSKDGPASGLLSAIKPGDIVVVSRRLAGHLPRNSAAALVVVP